MHPALRKGQLFTKKHTPHFPLFYKKQRPFSTFLQNTPIFHFLQKNIPISTFFTKITPISFPAYGPVDDKRRWSVRIEVCIVAAMWSCVAAEWKARSSGIQMNSWTKAVDQLTTCYRRPSTTGLSSHVLYVYHYQLSSSPYSLVTVLRSHCRDLSLPVTLVVIVEHSVEFVCVICVRGQ